MPTAYDRSLTVTGPYRDHRSATNLWSVTVKKGSSIRTERFSVKKDALAFAKQAKLSAGR